ncbi:dimethylsulfoxide reductase subunit B [Adlercreutzia equolifaciens]|uniref:DMSO/selenate family reductase complex B subunit n=1 Tax=Adlercreutzia equolifaciens TaxID=446660 RepID=UPI0023AE9116|nr:DMSO/selenate family reductase complex B subunit [Adlercreutzia equolifaciens]MDE8703041.1 dimethylsulfoxide reductase subunit B [Adlercreutzia equolifaciens]
MQYGFYFDADRCGSCKACVMACRDKNDTLLGLKLRNVIDYGGGTWTEKDGIMQPDGVFVYAVSLSCNHCANPACVANCPTGAMTKREEDGIVYVDESVCIGCGTCAQSCPYGAPRLDTERGVSRKCNLCMDYLEEGGRPACVDACLMRCLDFGDIDELRAQYGDTCDIAPLPESSATNPSLVINPSPHAGKEGVIINLDCELA